MAILPKATINDIVNEVVESKLSGHPITSAAIVSDILMKRHGISYSQAKDLAYRSLKKKIQKIDSYAWVNVFRPNPQRRRMDITSPVATPRSNFHPQQNPTLPTNTKSASSIVEDSEDNMEENKDTSPPAFVTQSQSEVQPTQRRKTDSNTDILMYRDKMNVKHDDANDDDEASSANSSKCDSSDSGGYSSSNTESDDEDENGHIDGCFMCYGGGELIQCDGEGCNKAYHAECINVDIDTLPLIWHCTSCMSSAEEERKKNGATEPASNVIMYGDDLYESSHIMDSETMQLNSLNASNRGEHHSLVLQNQASNNKEETAVPAVPSSPDSDATLELFCRRETQIRTNTVDVMSRKRKPGQKEDSVDGAFANNEESVHLVGHKYSIGTLVSKVFFLDGEGGATESFSGEVVAIGYDDYSNLTYKVLFVDGDIEILTEKELVKIVGRKKKKSSPNFYNDPKTTLPSGTITEIYPEFELATMVSAKSRYERNSSAANGDDGDEDVVGGGDLTYQL